MSNTEQVLANVNFSRYSSAVFVVAQKEMWRTFHWLYHHHHPDPELYVGQCLRNTKNGMKGIGAREKAALDRQEDPANMDIPLLYRLLQHTCGLAPETSEFAWNKPPSEAEQPCLEHWLYQIKNLRNTLCHDHTAFMHMTDTELSTHLQELTGLLCNTVQEAGQRSTQPAAQVEAALVSIRERLTNIQASMPPSAILPQEFALLARRELAEQWQDTTTWGKQLSPPLLRWAFGGQEVPLSQLLQGLGEEQPPQVLLVLGEAGIGKSSLCWQLLQAWLWGDPELPEVAALELVLMVECRQVFTRDLKSLLVEELLHKTCRQCRPEEVPSLLGALRVLWLVDGFEEATADARSLLSRLVKRCSASHVVLVTGQQDYLDEVRATLSSVNSQVCHITHNGLTQHGFSTLLANLLQEPVPGKQCAAFTQEVNALSPVLLQELHNPLKLTMAVQLWEEGRLRKATGAPLTDLYTAIQKTLVAKLVTKLQAKNSLTEAEAGQRVKQWVAALCGEAMAMLARGCFVNLDGKAEQHLRDRAMELLLPYTDCFSTFLGCWTRPGTQHSFLHHTQQGVMAAQHLCTLLLQGHTAEEVKCLLLPGHPSNTRMDRFLNVLIHSAASLAAEGNLDEERAKILAILLEQCDCCQWLEVVHRTKCCLPMTREAHVRLTDKWVVTDSTVEAAAALVRIGAPNTIVIKLLCDPRDNPDLLPLLQCLSKTSVKVTLRAYHCLHDGIQPEVPLYSVDNLLQPLCDPGSSCHLVEFFGLLTSDGCHALQHHQHTIRILHVAVPDCMALDQVILLSHQAELLEALCIRLFCSLEANPKMSVPERVHVSLFLPKVEDKEEAEKTVALIRHIGHTFFFITLGMATPVALCGMLRAFKKQKVRAKSLGSWVKVAISDEAKYRHAHFLPLPPPHDIALHSVYKMWSNPRIVCELNVDETGVSFVDLYHDTQTSTD